MKFETIFNAQGDNLAEKLTEEELGKISASVHQGYKDDRTSRRGWEAHAYYAGFNGLSCQKNA